MATTKFDKPVGTEIESLSYKLTPNTFTVTKNDEKVDTLSIEAAYKVGRICVISCHGDMKSDAITATYQTIKIATSSIQALSYVQAALIFNDGKAGVVAIDSAGDIYLKNYINASPNKGFHFELIFISAT